MERFPPIDTLDGTIQAALSKVRRRRIPVSTPFGDTKPISLSYLMLRDVETVGEFDRLLSSSCLRPKACVFRVSPSKRTRRDITIAANTISRLHRGI